MAGFFQMPERIKALEGWLRECVGVAPFTLHPASGDASFRRYFRLLFPDGASLIAMDAPPERERCDAFVDLAGRLAAFGVHVPRVHAHDLEQGFVLLEDLGERLYLDALDAGSVERLYGDALATLVVIQACGPRQDLPPYDAPLLRRELAIFPEWLLEHRLGLRLDTATRTLLADAFERLVDNALEQPVVCVHRDYHSRNLLLTRSHNPGVIDFQDAVLGPVTYDLVSLLRDCYIAWPRERVEGWAMGYFQLALQSGVVRPGDEARFLRWFDLMGMQRHLKAAGIFARLDCRDGKPGYLKEIPRTLGYVVEVAGRYPELVRFGAWIEACVLGRL